MLERSYHLDYLQILLLATKKIYSWVYDAGWTLLFSNCPYENELKNIFLLNENHKKCEHYAASGHYSTYLIDKTGLTWISICHAPEGQIQTYHIIGPVFGNTVSDSFLMEQLGAEEMRQSSKVKFLQLASSLPVVSMSTFGEYGKMLYYTLYQNLTEDFGYSFIGESRAVTEADPMDLSTPTHQGSVQNEQELLSFVENGDDSCLTQQSVLDPERFANVGSLCPGNPLRQAKDEILVYTALVTRAAIRGGMNQESAYNLSDYYIQTLESYDEISDVYSLSQEMYADFIKQVKRAKESPSYSVPVSDFLALLKRHLLDDYTIGDIAKELGYSPYYLTNLVKKETGKSYKQLVKDTKIALAKIRLKNPYQSISALSEELKFTTPSYFAAVFKEQTGMTPREYRFKKSPL